MKKTSIYLDPALASAVDEGTSARVTAIGVAEGSGGVAEDVDRHLEETGFGRT